MSIHTAIQKSGRRGDLIKWLMVAILLLIATVGNYSYHNYNVTLRTVVVLMILVIAGVLALITTTGQYTIAFAREARTEARKIIWPTKQETLHTTLIVVAVTIIMSLLMWCLDSMLLFLVSYITSLRLS